MPQWGIALAVVVAKDSYTNGKAITAFDHEVQLSIKQAFANELV